ncbi:T9SS type A sorting domain-containing protein [Formosa maritima]|uniref:T9SS type A sorting domain-containing protein n=1 Tax=Formosa maritima TaxID=2592046 RepID=A0A5D0G107_9FLAO|nr:T9SS type A sorting domain-containing protein [Formosa maritima]TYA52424.1 T9SS type A sorting domain-containing protein [Formosa maritima]
MKKFSLLIFGVLLVSLFTLFVIKNNNISTNEESLVSVEELKQKHKENLEKSPFTESLKLSKEERKANGLPPNKYNEEMWELTMNPALGRPTPEKVAELQRQLLEERRQDLLNGRVPGDAIDNGWLERGPNNVGGRTRALMFDPTDANNNVVFAGGVSGGLWKNTDISNASSVWTRVDIPENLAVSVITYDPNNPSTFYVGTGESYVGHTDGSVNGDGLWKSTDAGETWTNIFGGNTGTSYFVSASTITVNSPSGIAGDYQSYPTTAFGTEITSTIIADFVLANDGTGVPTEACNSFGPSAAGKIAVIRRGDCPFVDKVLNAQNAGAVGVIMMNNVPGEPVPMGGTNGSITIPSVMISMSDGDILEAAMASGTVNGSLNPSSGDFTAMVVPGVQQINDVKVRNNGGNSEIYVAAGDAVYGSSNAATTIGGLTYGMYKSVDGGANWSYIDLPLTADGHKHAPNDIEIGPNGKIWMSTTNSHLYGDGGGKVFSSTDGNTFTQVYAINGAARTQIAVSSTVADKVYVLAETSTGVTIKKTTSAFVPIFLVQNKALPTDADPGVTPEFTRGQAWFDLMLEVDPTNDEIVYVGGIDLFKSTNGATTWNQFSHWYGGFGFQEVHSDQHIAAFGHGDSNKVIFGNDGGVYYSANGGTTTQSRNVGYNTSQFYTAGVAPTTALSGDYFAGGLQDNGTQLLQNANPNGVDDAIEPYGGDGAYTFFDQDGTDRYFIRNYVYNSGINLRHLNADGSLGTNVTINNEGASNGAFINPQALDSNLDILYSNYSSGGVFVIKRYSGIKSAATLTSSDLTNATELTTTPTAFTVSTHTTGSSKLLVGTRLGDVILVENANTASPTWTNLDGNVLVGSVSDLEFGQSDNDIFVTMHNYGVNNVWYTSDGGTTWEAKDGDLPDLPVKAILQNPLNLEEVIIGTELGVWYTNNFSASSPTWRSAFNGMSNVKVLDLDLRDDNMVFAATHGRGIFSGMFTPDFLSVEENTLASDLTLYPTVSNGEITISAKSNIGKINLAIYNLSGQLIYNSALDMSTNNRKQLSLDLSSGLYLAKFSKGSFTETKKFIIK